MRMAYDKRKEKEALQKEMSASPEHEERGLQELRQKKRKAQLWRLASNNGGYSGGSS